MRPDVWAPHAKAVELVFGDGDADIARMPLERGEEGWFVGGPALDHGTRYGFRLDGGEPLPDPRSRWQPDGVHGLSAVDDPTLHEWGDDPWDGLELLGGVIYELHVGTFTAEGTFDAAIERLDHVAELGVAAVELMPVAEAMGERGWGYDGVDLWAPHHAYGGPAGLRRFVDATHRRGLGVLLDVVYNHLGPEGSYLERFGPYFTDRHHTPWGRAVNLDGPGSTEVRRFIVDNAAHWCVDHHIDGLRVDAAHHLIDDRPIHIVGELTSTLAELGAATGRRRWVVVEREQPNPLPLLDPANGGWGADARWGDDLHHALHAHLTGETHGYYAAFGGLAQIRTALTSGQVLGDPLPQALAPTQLVTCTQNHDQVGNRVEGERLSHLVGAAPAMAAATLVLLGPGTPLLFQGEEWASSSPFPFFCDTDDQDLAARIRAGRRTEFEAFEWDSGGADPLDPAVVARATLHWSELAEHDHLAVHKWYRTLIALRAEHPELARGERPEVKVDNEAGTVVMRRGTVTIIVHLADGEASVPSHAGAEIVARHGAVDAGDGALVLGPYAVAVTRRGGERLVEPRDG